MNAILSGYRCRQLIRGSVMTDQIIQGDCLEVLRGLPDCSVDAIVTDPPYGLSKEPNVVEVLNHWIVGDDYKHKGSGFMQAAWDSFVPGPSVWKEVFRVLKPGGHLLAFAGTRTQDLMAISLRMAGFEFRDCLMWAFGSGFPKSHNLDGDWQGWGSALKPAYEPILLMRKPSPLTIADTVQEWGTGAINVDGCRVGTETRTQKLIDGGNVYGQTDKIDSPTDRGKNGKKATITKSYRGRWPANLILSDDDETRGCFPEATSGQKHRDRKHAGWEKHGEICDVQVQHKVP
jgi:hypothetical protein